MRPATHPPGRSASRLRASQSRTITASHDRITTTASVWPIVLTVSAVLSMLGLIGNLLWFILLR